MAQVQGIFKHTSFNSEQHKAFTAIIYLASICERHLGQMLEPFQLPVNKYRILSGLKNVYPEGVGIYKLREFLIDQNADTSRLTERLLKMGLVESKSDSRNKSIKQIVITNKGLDLVEEINSHHDEFIAPMMCLSDTEAKQLNETVKKILKSFAEVKTTSPRF